MITIKCINEAFGKRNYNQEAKDLSSCGFLDSLGLESLKILPEKKCVCISSIPCEMSW